MDYHFNTRLVGDHRKGQGVQVGLFHLDFHANQRKRTIF